MTKAIPATGSIESKGARRMSFWAQLSLRLVREKPLGTVGGAIALLVFLVGIFASLIAPYGMNEVHLGDALQSSTAKHLMGTDQIGRDILSRVIYGAQISMIVGIGATAINTLVSLLIGVTSGFIGGKLDLIVQRFVDTWMCFPALIMYLSVISLTGPGLTQVVVVLGVAGGIASSRTIRSVVIGIRRNVYVDAANAAGCSTLTTLVKHILPNIMPVIIIVSSTHVVGAILAEASLSFLGFGVPPPTPSWGGMLSGEGRRYMSVAPWMALWPGLALSVTVYGISMFGDALRDLLDPRLRGGLGRYSAASVRKKRGGFR
jgi:peptide/nickel transport system permease protein